MKTNLITIFFFTSILSFGQSSSNSKGEKKEIEKIQIPTGVVYKYCDPLVLEKTKKIINQSITTNKEYSLLTTILFIGPNLWSRLEKNKKLANIEGGNLTLNSGTETKQGKMTQEIADSEKIWDAIKEEIAGKKYTLRKANINELNYYWSVISFDIEEPLIILETAQHKYILNISPKTQKLIWLDEAL